MDVDAWRAFGGSVEGKVYIAPGGERTALGTWPRCAAHRARGPRPTAISSRAPLPSPGERLKTWKAAAKLMADVKKEAPASGAWPGRPHTPVRFE